MRALIAVLLAGMTAGAAAQAAGQRVEGTVTRVSDGDTLWLQPDGEGHGKPIKLRLDGIDAPESCQPWGTEATQALSARVMGRRVQVVLKARDAYRRWLVSLSMDGDDVSAWLVHEGHAWSYRSGRSAGPYAEQERAARGARRGLFSQRDPMQPQVFRRWHGPCDMPPRATGLPAVQSGQLSPAVHVRGAPGSK